MGWPDHTIIGTVPADVPTGEHEAIITVLPEPAAKPFGLTCRPKTSGGMVCLQSR